MAFVACSFTPLWQPPREDVPRGEGKDKQSFAGSVGQSMWYTDPNSGLTIINGSYSGVPLHLGPLQQGLGWSRTLGILKPVFGGWADINMSYEKVV